MSPRCNNTINSCVAGSPGRTATHTFLFITQSQSNTSEPAGFVTFNQEITKNGTDIVGPIPTNVVTLEQNRAYYIAYSVSATNDSGSPFFTTIALFANGVGIDESVVGQTADSGQILDISGSIILEARETVSLQLLCDVARTNLRSNLIIFELAALTPLLP